MKISAGCIFNLPATYSLQCQSQALLSCKEKMPM